MAAYNIHFVAHDQIDKAKWDNCIRQSSNALIYGHSFYLDVMARHWDGLVLDDYKVVMPLTWNKKFGIYYLYQPFTCAQLGVFGNNLNAELVENFLTAIPKKFKYWDIYLNHGNVFELKKFHLYQRKNFILNLDQPYENISNNYRENLQRNLKKSESLGLVLKKNIPFTDMLGLASAQMKKYTDRPGDFKRISILYAYLKNNYMADVYGIYSPENELLASALFFLFPGRIFYILVGNDPKGRTTGASHALIDGFIKEHAGQKTILDFEGSDVPGLAFFYSSFGAIQENYSAIRLNRLPFYLKWIKK